MMKYSNELLLPTHRQIQSNQINKRASKSVNYKMERQCDGTRMLLIRFDVKVANNYRQIYECLLQ